MDIVPAQPADRPAIRQLLGSSGLPDADVDLSGARYWVLYATGRLVGVIGVELHGTVGLLRSLAVIEGLRGGGVGKALVGVAEHYVREHGIVALYLLTTSAQHYFERLGYRSVPRGQVPDVIARTSQFSSLCPSSAVLMIKPMNHRPYNVLFLCTGNSARSILAEALMNHLPARAGKFHAYSAGSQPKGQVHPLALKVLQHASVPTEGLRSKTWDEFAAPGAPQMDFIFTVCDNAANEACPVWPGHPATAHWGLPDPAAVEGDEPTRYKAFHETFLQLRRRIELFCELPFDKLDGMALQQKLHEVGRA